jgi:hypothetical protein
MSEFFKTKNRSRLDRKQDEEITKKTVILGGVTVLIFVAVLVFGLPLLIKLSVLLGNSKNKIAETEEKFLPPLPPRLVLNFEATNSARFSINGVAEPNVEVELLKDDLSLGKEIVDEKGGFSFTDITLDRGGNTFTAIAFKEKEGQSELSKAVTVIYDDQAPSLEMLNPVEEKLTVEYSDFDIIGKSDKGVSVMVNGKLAVVDDEGGFKLKVQLNAGKNNMEIVVRSPAGNETRKTIELTYDI